MSDLRSLHTRVPVSTPPFETVTANARRIRVRQLGSAAVVLGAIAVLAGLSLAPPERAAVVPAEEQQTEHHAGGTTTITNASATPTTTVAPGVATVDPKVGLPARQYRCERGANGGATDTGVTRDRIQLFASGHLDGPEKALVEDVPFAWKAVIDRVNRSGGVCGRIIDLQVVDRGFRTMPGNALAFLVTPLDYDFDARLRAGAIDRLATPALIPDGYAEVHHHSAWARPLGASIASMTRIAADEAYRAGARTFGLVHDPEHAYGHEAAAALRDYVARLPGASVRVVEALDPEDPSYNTQAQHFRQQCGCDAVILDLFPETAKKWFQADPPRGSVRTSAMPLMLSPRLAAEDCASVRGPSCEGLWAWTAFTPPVADFMGDPEMKRYVEDVGEDNAFNPFTLTAYVSARVLVAALERTGPDLTRERLRSSLDTMTFTSALVDWPGRGRTARAVRAENGSFRDTGTGWRRDPG